MQQRRRQRRDAEGWRTMMRQFAESGLTVAKFCEREGLGEASFYRWRSLLSVPSVRKARLPLREPSIPKPTSTRNGFLDLGTLGTSPASRMEVRLDLGGGLVLHVVRG
ncbi:MAG: transposase [Pseudomonadota bacterium]|nr:transposase [Pseudomonadota bacterium]